MTAIKKNWLHGQPFAQSIPRQIDRFAIAWSAHAQLRTAFQVQAFGW